MTLTAIAPAAPQTTASATTGVWVTHDRTDSVAIHASAAEATQYALDHNHDVTFVPFGRTLAEVVYRLS